MRVSLSLCALSWVALMATGCATGTSWTWRKPTKPPSAAVAAQKGKSSSDEKSASKSEPKESPFVAERERTAKKPDSAARPADKAAEKPSERSKLADDAKEAALVGNTLSLPAETLKLINAELKDATPEERAQWYSQLKRVEPSLIPDILRARRMSLQIAQNSPADSVAGGSMTASTVQQTGFSPAPGTPQVNTAGYHAPAGSRPTVDPAIHRVDPQSSPPGVTLQGYETESPAAPGTPIAVQRSAMADPQAQTFSQPSTPAVPWPPAPQKVPPSAPQRSTLAFGAGLVKDVVGLVPTRNSGAPSSANSPVQTALQTTTDAEWRGELARSIAQLEQEIAAQKPGPLSDDDLRKHVALRLMYLLADHQERALTAIPGLEPAEQEFWQQVVWALANSLDVHHIPRAEDRATQTVAQLNTAVRRLQEKADLQIRNVVFSKQNFGYGNYDRFVRDEVRPGQEVLLYAEIENFKSDPTADGQYRTLLRSTIEILSPSGEVRKKIDFPATEDLCRNYRRDYFHNYQFTVPDRLPLGPHVLKLAVFDELSGKMSTHTLNFLVN